MKIEIVFTNDAGETAVLATNETVSDPKADARHIWQLRQDADAIRRLTLPESWAVSQTCQEMAFTYLPLDVSQPVSVLAAAQFHGLKLVQE